MDILVSFLTFSIVIAGGIACVKYWVWVEKAEALKDAEKQKEAEDLEEEMVGSKEATQHNIIRFIKYLNPFQNFWHDIKLYVGMLAIILACFAIINSLSG